MSHGLGVSLMLNLWGSNDNVFHRGSLLFVLCLPGAVNGKDDDKLETPPLLLVPILTEVVIGVWGGSSFGPMPPAYASHARRSPATAVGVVHARF